MCGIATVADTGMVTMDAEAEAAVSDTTIVEPDTWAVSTPTGGARYMRAPR